MILSPNDEFTTVGNLNFLKKKYFNNFSKKRFFEKQKNYLGPVNDKGVVISDVFFHELNALFEFNIFVIPGDSACCQTDNTTSKSGAMT